MISAVFSSDLVRQFPERHLKKLVIAGGAIAIGMVVWRTLFQSHATSASPPLQQKSVTPAQNKGPVKPRALARQASDDDNKPFDRSLVSDEMGF